MIILIKIFLLAGIAAGVWYYLTDDDKSMESAMLSVLVGFCTFVGATVVYIFLYFMIMVW